MNECMYERMNAGMHACPRAVFIMPQDFVSFREKNWNHSSLKNLISKMG